MKKPLVVGYKGEIGRFILSGLLRTLPNAVDIFCVDKNDTEENVVQRIMDCDTIFLCVPMADTVKWLKRHWDLCKGKLIVEQTSLKGWIEGCPGQNYLSMHILFRPSETPNKEDRRVVIIEQPKKDLEYYAMFDVIEKITESTIELCKSIEIHDKCMAMNQALVHRVIVKLGQEIRMTPYRTFISQKVIDLADRIERGGDLVLEIQKNPRMIPFLNGFKNNLTINPLFM